MQTESRKNQLRGAAILALPVALIAAPALATSIGGDAGIAALPANLDPNSVPLLLCIYIMRDGYLRQMRTLERLLLEKKNGESE